MEKIIEVTKTGLHIITTDGELIGIIYNDMNKKAKRLFWVEEMSEEDIAELLVGKLSTVFISSAIAKDKD